MFDDKILNELHKKFGTHRFEDRNEFLFQDLVESIISQQLSTKAANTIYSRFLELFGKNPHKKRDGSTEFPTPEEILKMDTEKLRGAGMSYSKAGYVKNIAQAFKDGNLDVKKIEKMSDEEVIKELTKIKGVGKWTAEMILIFTLNRPDVFSLGDAGLKRAIKNLYKLEKEAEILELAAKWSPKRSLACWYLWKSLDNEPLQND